MYLSVKDDANVSSGWLQKGSWRVDGWLLVLSVPRYQEERTFYSAAASCKMTLDYIRQDTILTQDQIYNYVATGSRELNPQDIERALNHFKPAAYNFSFIAKSDITEAMRDIAHWMDYEVPGAAIPNTSVAIPTFGRYDNWMVVRGAATSQDPNANQNLWEPAEFTVYGFWLNDPAVEGIGENSYKTAAELENTYYLPLSTTDAWAGKYVAVAEPPEIISNARVNIAQPYRNNYNMHLGVLSRANDQLDTILEKESSSFSISGVNALAYKSEILKQRFKYFDWKKIIDPFLLKDKDFNAAINNAFARSLIKVRMIGSNNYYYLVPFDKFVYNKYNMRHQGQLFKRDNFTSVVLIINGSDFTFKEASWTRKPIKYSIISRAEALQLVQRRLFPWRLYILLAQRIFCPARLSEERLAGNIKAELVWQAGNISSSPYEPFWRIVIQNKEYFVTQGRKVIFSGKVNGQL